MSNNQTQEAIAKVVEHIKNMNLFFKCVFTLIVILALSLVEILLPVVIASITILFGMLVVWGILKLFFFPFKWVFKKFKNWL